MIGPSLDIDDIIFTDSLVAAAIETLAAAINDANGAMQAARKLYGLAPAPRPYFRLVQDRKNFPAA